MLHLFYRDDDGSALEITNWLDLSDGNFKTACNAEQGSVGSASFVLTDPLGELNIVGHRRVWAMEDSAPVGHQMIFWGYTTSREVKRGTEQTGVARQWTVNIVDVNSLLERKVMAGEDTDRPAENDVERVQWLMTTGEAGFFDDTTTYIETTSPKDMDEADYNGQMFAGILTDASEQSGRNWYARFPYDEDISDYRAAVWYAHDDAPFALSDLRISNVIGDVDYETTWYASLDSTWKPDPSRVYSGIFGNFDGAYTYRTRPATIAEFANRDTIAQWPNVKTLAKAQARGDRELLDLHTEEEIISTTILVSPEHVNDAMAGDMIEVRYTHFPGFDAFREVRILNRVVTFLTPEWYQIDFELTPPAPAPPSEHLLVAFISASNLGEPADLSSESWTKVWWTGNFSNAGQFPGPGGPSACGMWVRSVVEGESATVLQVANGSGGVMSAWVFQVDGAELADLDFDYGIDTLAYSLGGAATVTSPSAAEPSVWIGGFALQKVNYGQATTIDDTDGTVLRNVNGANIEKVCNEDDANPPKVWLGYETGTGAMTIGGTLDCDGAGPGDYNFYGRGYGGILLKTPGTFSVVQQGFDIHGSGVDCTVTLPSAP